MIQFLLLYWKYIAITALCAVIAALIMQINSLKRDVQVAESRIAILQAVNEGFKGQVEVQNDAIAELQKQGKAREEAAKIAVSEAQSTVNEMAKRALDIRTATPGTDNCKSAQLLIERVLGVK